MYIHYSKISVHLVISFDIALVQRAVLSITSKHDQTHQTTQTEDDLLARENNIAGPETTQEVRTIWINGE